MALLQSDTESVLMKEKTVLCFFVEGTDRKEWTYAQKLQPVGPKTKVCVVLMMEEDELAYMPVTQINKAFDRMIDNSNTPGKAHSPPPYVVQFQKKTFNWN